VKINKEERVKELYMSLASCKLPDDLARIYMTEYLALTGIPKEAGSLTFFYDKIPPTNKVDLLILRAWPAMMLFGAGLIFGAIIKAVKEAQKRDPVYDRVEYLLDPIRVESYTSEQFQDAIAEASVLLTEKIKDLQKE